MFPHFPVKQKDFFIKQEFLVREKHVWNNNENKTNTKSNYANICEKKTELLIKKELLQLVLDEIDIYQNSFEYEKKISFLNRYIIYKKNIEVNTDKVIIEINDYEETENNRDVEEKSIKVAKKEIIKTKAKIRKLNKKIQLVPATDSFD